MRSYASHLLQHIGGNASQARLKCIAKCDAIPDKLCPAFIGSPRYSSDCDVLSIDPCTLKWLSHAGSLVGQHHCVEGV